MISIFKNRSINQVTKITVVFTAFLTIFITFMLFLNTYSDHLIELEKIENDYLKSQKEIIKNETKRAIRYIKYMHSTLKDSSDVKKLQSDIVETIENMRDIRKGSGYIFIYTFDGVNIADPILKYNAGKNLINFKDHNGKLVIKELIDISKQDNGGFVDYVWNKPTTNILTNKISYASSYKPWNWMVGSGIYLDDIQNVLKQKKKDYKQKIVEYILQITMFTVALFLSSMAVSRYFTFLIQKDINTMKETLKNVSINYDNINLDEIRFKEYKLISFNINLMINELKDLNTNLEFQVENRTKELQNSEKFAHNLVESQDKFIKNAIHEINTPLSIIITSIDLFKLRYDENKYLSKIEAASKIIHNIYNDLEYLVKKDRIKYLKNDINLSSFVKDRADFFIEIANGNNLNFNLDIQNDLIISLNDIELQRICDNTISNAIKYSYENNTIEIKLYKLKENIVFDIINIGDTVNDIDKLFDRFYRENTSRGGFGIGLNIIKEICDKNKIKMEVHSKDKVTTFRYIFKDEIK